MRTNNREWTNYESSAYRQARREGLPIGLAFTRALSERVAHRVLPPRDTTDGYGATSYRVDAAELAAATSDPRTDVLFGTVTDSTTGRRILSRVTLPADARAVVTVRDDVDADPRTDGDWATPDDVTAWQEDRWRYLTVEAHVTLPDGRSATEAAGAVMVGHYFGTSWEAGIIHVVPSLISEALRALSAPHDLAGPVASWPV